MPRPRWTYGLIIEMDETGHLGVSRKFLGHVEGAEIQCAPTDAADAAVRERLEAFDHHLRELVEDLRQLGMQPLFLAGE